MEGGQDFQFAGVHRRSYLDAIEIQARKNLKKSRNIVTVLEWLWLALLILLCTWIVVSNEGLDDIYWGNGVFLSLQVIA